jgi:hypothetical protein
MLQYLVECLFSMTLLHGGAWEVHDAGQLHFAGGGGVQTVASDHRPRCLRIAMVNLLGDLDNLPEEAA